MQRRKAQAQEVGGNAAKDQKQIWTSSWWINHPGSVHTKLINAIQQLLVKNDKQGEEEGVGVGGLLQRESLIEDLQYLAILLMKNLHTNTSVQNFYRF